MEMARRIHTTVSILGVLLAFFPLVPGSVTAQSGENHAGLVLKFADGSTRSYCIPFTGESITGLDLLLKTGLEVKVESFGGSGALICKIGPDGCDYPEQPCVCQSYGPGGVYWSYHHLKAGRWATSSVGVSSYHVRNGDVDGLAWSAGKPPPLLTFGQVCSDLQPQSSASVQPTSTLRPPLPVPTKPLPTFAPTPPRQEATQPATISPHVIRSTPVRTPTTAHKPSSTATVRRQTVSSTGTATPRPATATPSITPIPSSTREATPEDPPTSTHTVLPSLTSTVLPTGTAIPTLSLPTIISAGTKTAMAPSQAPVDAEGDARNIAIIVGSIALAGLAALGIWRGRRKRGPDGG